jgi:hypothetical protein
MPDLAHIRREHIDFRSTFPAMLLLSGKYGDIVMPSGLCDENRVLARAWQDVAGPDHLSAKIVAVKVTAIARKYAGLRISTL